MESSSDGEGNNAPTPPVTEVKAGKRIAFGKVFGKARSATMTEKLSSSPQPTTEVALRRHPNTKGELTRSKSEDVGFPCRDEWAEGIWGQEKLQQSFLALRNSVSDYEKEATQQQWKDLLKINSDVAELGQLASEHQLRKAAKEGGKEDKSIDGLSKFSTVALEYSKMLDVVMNQSPEYAGLAWGVGFAQHWSSMDHAKFLQAIRMLLVAHTNHSKLKHAVEHYLVLFGQEFGVVNQLMNSLPTQKMVEAVSDAYAAFSKFLAKAVKYYKESKLMSALKAFGFPWGTVLISSCWCSS